MTYKERADYARLYIGCECEVMFEDANGKFTIKRKGIMSWSHEEDCEWIIYTPEPEDYQLDIDFEEWDYRWKLILRPPESITADEIIELEKIAPSIEKEKNTISFYAKRTAWLLKHQFDLFNLIGTEIAINKETI